MHFFVVKTNCIIGKFNVKVADSAILQNRPGAQHLMGSCIDLVSAQSQTLAMKHVDC